MVKEKLPYRVFVRSRLMHVNFRLENPDATSADNHVRPQTEAEEQLYDILSKVTQKPGSVLSSRWSEPSLTVHNIDVSGPGSKWCLLLTLEYRSLC